MRASIRLRGMKAVEEGTNTLLKHTGGDECEVRPKEVMMVTLGHLIMPVPSGSQPGRLFPGVREARAPLNPVGASLAGILVLHATVSRCSSHCTTHASPYVCFCFFGSGMFV